MTISNNRIASQWINNQLDLYNLAVSLGDQVWQDQILDRLRSKEEYIQREIQEQAWQDLWLRFDDINRKILGIYEQLHTSVSEGHKSSLREQAWELRALRVQIGKKLRESQPGISNVLQRG
ncbi:hypothetical protein [Cohnella mopanensis]|uniref:hypothetical protein n=1 Tax=Cohnella mopanensis TaxID=2911966 RepID=UPI001EF8971C|nr:hypothetical protein [Cohnella mopanensis]